MVKNLINHERPVINGHGTYSIDFTYIDNVIQANEKSLLAPEEQMLKDSKRRFGKVGKLEEWKEGKME